MSSELMNSELCIVLSLMFLLLYYQCHGPLNALNANLRPLIVPATIKERKKYVMLTGMRYVSHKEQSVNGVRMPP